MSTPASGRRVRVSTTDADGLPLVRYGVLVERDGRAPPHPAADSRAAGDTDADGTSDGRSDGTATHGTPARPAGPHVIVLLDGADAGAITVDRRAVEPLDLTSFELRLEGTDLLGDPALRRGLLGLWRAELEAAGLWFDALHPVGDGVRDSSEGYLLAEMVAGGQHFVVRGVLTPTGTVVVRVDRPTRFEL